MSGGMKRTTYFEIEFPDGPVIKLENGHFFRPEAVRMEFHVGSVLVSVRGASGPEEWGPTTALVRLSFSVFDRDVDDTDVHEMMYGLGAEHLRGRSEERFAETLFFKFCVSRVVPTVEDVLAVYFPKTRAWYDRTLPALRKEWRERKLAELLTPEELARIGIPFPLTATEELES